MIGGKEIIKIWLSKQQFAAIKQTWNERVINIFGLTWRTSITCMMLWYGGNIQGSQSCRVDSCTSTKYGNLLLSRNMMLCKFLFAVTSTTFEWPSDDPVLTKLWVPNLDLELCYELFSFCWDVCWRFSSWNMHEKWRCYRQLLNIDSEWTASRPWNCHTNTTHYTIQL